MVVKLWIIYLIFSTLMQEKKIKQDCQYQQASSQERVLDAVQYFTY